MTGAALEASPRKRVWKGLSASALGQAVAAAQAIVLVPFFLHAWGADLYGRWLALTAAVSYLTLLDLGGKSYIANLLAIRHAQGDEAGFRKVLSEGVSLFIFVSLGTCAVMLILLGVFLRTPFPGLGRPFLGWEAQVLGLIGASCLLAIPSGVYGSCFRAAGLFARGAIVRIFVVCAWIVVSMGLLYASVSLEAYAAATLGFGIASTSAVVWDTRRCIPGCKGLRIGLAPARQGWAHLGGSLHFWVIALAEVAKIQGVVLVLAFIAPPAAVAAFATHRTLASISGYTSVLVQGPVIPELSFLWAQQRHADLQRAAFASVKLLMVAAGSVALLLWLSAPLAYPLWTGGKLPLEPDLLLILLVQGVLAAGWSTSAWALLATNHHRVLTGWFLGNAAVTLVLAAWLGSAHGAAGVAAAGLIGDLLCGLAAFPVLGSFFLKLPPGRLYRELCAGALTLLPLAGAAYLARVFLNGWWSVAFFVLAGAGLAYPMLRKEPGVAGAMRDVQHFAADWARKTR